MYIYGLIDFGFAGIYPSGPWKSKGRGALWEVSQVLVEVSEIASYLNEMPKEFEIRELATVMAQDGRKVPLNTLSRTLGRMTGQVVCFKKERRQVDGVRLRYIYYRKVRA